MYSKDLEPLPANFLSTFISNQFRTTIPLPTKNDYPHVRGKCAIVTGSNTGLGFEASRQLLALGLSHLVLGVRSTDKGAKAADQLQLANPEAKIEVWHLDMESYKSIQGFARRCERELDRIDMVILNAGLSPADFAVSPETGHERTIQVNHHGTALLVLLLLPVLKGKRFAGQDTPVMSVVSSVTAHICKLDNKSARPFLTSFDDTTVTPWDDPHGRYGVSKLLNQLFLAKLASEVNPQDVIINMNDPGLTKGTGLFQEVAGFVMKLLVAIAGRPVERGAATYVHAVLGHGKESHGCFLMNCRVSPLSGWFYSDGDTLTEAIWAETIAELDFAGVKGILDSMAA